MINHRRPYGLLSALIFALFAVWNNLYGQEKPTLNYYLPDVAYDPAVPTPAQYLGFEIGEWHISHDQLIGYMHTLDAASDRISIREYGRSFEHRPLLCLTITAPENQTRLDAIRQGRRRLADPAVSTGLDPAAFPAVSYIGYSIHGNEASGSNAAMLVAYYLAAARTPEVADLLKNTVILLDPSFNPDGMQRFSAWVNSRRSLSLMPDPAHDEFNEPWPGGRTNHYWFDLNRDWLVMQQPESVGRVAIFQDWLPNTLTDHHEMGSNSTFFFQPGVPSRVNPVTPARNQELTARIAQYHARLLSEKKILFFSEENYDDFYYGKGSTYPDVNGCIGILFEQASSRGSAQETDNGLLSFPYTIRNHVLTSLSTLAAVRDMRADLNGYLRDFYRSALEEADKDPVAGYIFGDTLLNQPAAEFLGLLLRHRIAVYPLGKDWSRGEQIFRANQAWVIPAAQPAYRLIKGIFQRETTFADSIFYDISAWTLPDAFGLPWTTLDKRALNTLPPSAPLTTAPAPRALLQAPGPDTYAFAVESESYELPRLLSALHRAGLRVKLATQAFRAGNLNFSAGSLLIPIENQPLTALAIFEIMQQSGAQDIRVHNLNSGLTPAGPDLGSSAFVVLRAPKIAVLTGRGVSASDAGEIWHLLDTRYGLAPLLLDAERFGRADLGKYNVIVLPDGSFGGVPIEKIREFVTGGGTLVATGSSLRWLKSAGLAGLEFRNTPKAAGSGRRPYSELNEDRAALNLPGAIFEVELDRSNPLCYGYTRNRIPMFQGDTIFVETADNPYATPAVFTDKPLLAGYVHERQRNLLPGAAAIVVGGIGNGRIICFSGDPNFRAFWYGTNRLFANAVFFGNLISGAAVERK